MANIATSLLGRFIPESSGLSDEDKSALARQGLLSLGLGILGSRSGGNFGTSLADGLKSGLLAINQGADDISSRQYKQAMLASQTGGGSDFQALDAKARAAGYEPGSEDYKRAVQINLGVLPRAVTGAAKPQMVTGADGVQRIGTFDPATRQWSVFDGQNWVVAGPGQSPSAVQAAQQQLYIDPSLPPEVQAAIRANPDAPQFGSPQAPLQAANPGIFAGRPKEQEAAAVAGAQAAATLPYTQAEISYRTNEGIRGAGAEALAKANVDQAAKRSDTANTNATALRAYEAAKKGLETGLSGATTNPVVGGLPAMTTNQQIAQGSVAAMAPVLKQLFRSAGEGTFTDSDQKLLMDMVPTRMDLPAARAAKLANIDAIVRAKLNVPQPAQISTGEAGTNGKKRRKYNPATRKLEDAN